MILATVNSFVFLNFSFIDLLLEFFFCIITLYLATLLNVFIYFYNFLSALLGLLFAGFPLVAE